MIKFIHPQELPILKNNQIHVWLIHINSMQKYLNNYELILSNEEISRAKRYYFEKDQFSFIIRRGVLKFLLSYYLNISTEFDFEFNEYKKPYLKTKRPFEFNVSHSKEYALIAVTFGKPVGIDIEYINEDIDRLQIAQRFFSKQESDRLLALPEELQLGAFYNCWTRKEAYIKALGRGLYKSLDKFQVSIETGKPAQLLKDDENSISDWSLTDISLNKQYKGALATENKNFQTHYYFWNNKLY